MEEGPADRQAPLLFSKVVELGSYASAGTRSSVLSLAGMKIPMTPRMPMLMTMFRKKARKAMRRRAPESPARIM